MKHKNHNFNKFIIYINMKFSIAEFHEIWGTSNLKIVEHLWNKYLVENKGEFLSFYASLDDNNRDILIDYLDKNA